MQPTKNQGKLGSVKADEDKCDAVYLSIRESNELLKFKERTNLKTGKTILDKKGTKPLNLNDLTRQEETFVCVEHFASLCVRQCERETSAPDKLRRNTFHIFSRYKDMH